MATPSHPQMVCPLLTSIVLVVLPSVVRAQPPSPEDLANALEAMFQELAGEVPGQPQADRALPVTIQEERRYGEQIFSQYLRQLEQSGVRILRRGRDVEYVRGLVAEIRPSMTQGDRYRKIEVFVADTDDTDARCFPGGWIIISRGLIDFAETEAALVGVLAHELSHLDRGHMLGLLRTVKQFEDNLRRLRPQDLSTWMRDGSSFLRLFMKPFRPEDEAEADRDAVDWAFRAGYEPLEYAKIFARLEEQQGDQGFVVPQFFRTHPPHADRFLLSRQQATELAAGAPDRERYLGRENLQRRVTRDRRRFDE